MYRAGGFSGVALGLAYLCITGLYVTAGSVPTGVEERLLYLSGHTVAWWAILFLSVLTDILFFPLLAAVCVELGPKNKVALVAGAGMVGLFALLDLAVTWPNYASLLGLSGWFEATAGDPAQAIYASASAAPAALLDSVLFAVYAILLPAIGILVLGVLMRRSEFGLAASYSGVLAGILGVVAVVGPLLSEGLGILAIPASVLTTVWVLIVGWRLLRSARSGR